MSAKTPEQINEDLLRPLTGRLGALSDRAGACFGDGRARWLLRPSAGRSITASASRASRRPVFWGFYITNFVFWIGISHAGTLISAILRLANATWRRPVTRCAEVITVFALLIGAMFPIIHLGRPWLFFWLVPYPERARHLAQLPLAAALGLLRHQHLLDGSVIFLLLPMIPDFALVRDRDNRPGARRSTPSLALGWRGTPKQWHRLETAMHIMAIAIIPVAVSVHTIVSWDFAMAPVPMWHSTIFAPYFVAGAIFSGIAALIIAMALLRKFLHLEEYLLPDSLRESRASCC